MTDEELIAALREWQPYADEDVYMLEAADRIEALVKERDQWIEHTKNAVWTDSEELKLANVRAERLVEALRKIADMPDYRLPKPQVIAHAALAEFEGEK